MIYKIASRAFLFIGTLTMFIPMLTGDNSLRYIFIGGGLLLGILGVMLIGVKEEKKRDENILDDGEF